MKKAILTLAFVLVSVIAFAQLPLKGTWCQSQSAFGFSVAQHLTFMDDNAGDVTSVADIVIKVSMLGTKLNCTMKCDMKGTFELNGTDMVIKWDPNSFVVTTVKPLEVSVKGETDPKLEEETREKLNEMVDELKKEIEHDDIYKDVQIKGGKLLMKSKNEKGKFETEKYTRE